MVSPAALLLMLIAALTLAAPAFDSQSPTPVFKREVDPTDVICGPPGDEVRYTKDQVVKAMEPMAKYFNVVNRNKPQTPTNPRTGRTTPYPHEFKVNNDQRSPEVIKKLDELRYSHRGQDNTKYFEYPLTNQPWEGGDPKMDRVLGITYGQKTSEYHGLIYSMVMTHRGSSDWNGLVPCRPA